MIIIVRSPKYCRSGIFFSLLVLNYVRWRIKLGYKAYGLGFRQGAKFRILGFETWVECRISLLVATTLRQRPLRLQMLMLFWDTDSDTNGSQNEYLYE